MWDIVIKNVEVCDGTGTDSYIADIAIAGKQIVRIGVVTEEAVRTIDGTGLTATPGLIDPHSHADCLFMLPSERQAELMQGRLFQGVTTTIAGNCGLGIAPCSHTAVESLNAINAWMMPEGVELQASKFESYLNSIEHIRPPLNVGFLIPHGPVRISVMGLESRAPSARELDSMAALVREGLEAGGFGLSSGLIYPPGMYSAPSELEHLARLTARYGRVYTSHIRGSSETLIQALQELIQLGRATGSQIHHSHNEAVGRSYWPLIETTLRLHEEASQEGLQISYDVFPYPMAATMMVAIYPPWALEGGISALLKRLEDPVERALIRADIENTESKWESWEGRGWPHNLVAATGWSSIYIGYVRRQKQFEGLSLTELSEKVSKDPFNAVSDLMIEEQGAVSMLIYEISGDDECQIYFRKLLEHPLAAVCSDAEDYGRGLPHPAAYGAFARVLSRYTDTKLSFEQAIHKMTGYTASIFGIKDRGLLRAGMYADIAIFDRSEISDRSTATTPRRLATGLKYLILNGQLTIDEGRYYLQQGEVLRRCI